MLRAAVAVASLGGALLAASATQAATYPVPTVSSPHGSVVAASDGWCVIKYHTEPSWRICGGAGIPFPPELAVVPGETVTIALNAPELGVTVDSFRTMLASTGDPVTASPPNAPLSLVIPADFTLPEYLWFNIDAQDDTMAWHGAAAVKLVPVPAPAATPAPQEAAPKPPAGVTLRSVKLKGKRLTLTATCAAAQGCDGTITLRSSGLRIARLNVGSIANGTTKTLKKRIAASRVRHLHRHKVKFLRAVITPAKGQPLVSQLRLAHNAAFHPRQWRGVTDAGLAL
jgi:hypothetical protein